MPMNTIDFTRRSTQDELMDTEEVSFEVLRGCLVDLATVNRLTMAYAPTLAFFDRVVSRGWLKERPLRVLDVGSGYGDTLRRVEAWGAKKGVPLELTGVDMNPWCTRSAREASPSSSRISWVTADAFEYAPDDPVDVIISSLFTHHLGDEALVRFLSFMHDRADLGWFVNDLHRHPLPHAFFTRWSKLANFHRFVQHDGPVSIERAFSRVDWKRLLTEAHIDPASVEIRWRFPFKLTVASFR